MKKYLPLITTLFFTLFLSFQSYSQIDNFPGTALAFDGENDYVFGTGIDTTLSAITIETWIYHDSLPAEVQRYVTIKPEVAVLRFDGTQYGGYHSLHFYIKKANGALYSIRVDSVLVTNKWMHIAGTYDGDTMKLYLNGELLNTRIPNGGLFHPDGDFYFSSSGSPFDGKMEEVRLWSIARTEQEIRENMYLPLSGNETGLVSYWQFNDGSGDTLVEPVSDNNGTLYNMDDADWVNSTIPFGAGDVNTQIVSGTGNLVFTNTDLSMNFTAKTGTDTIVVTKIDTAANFNPESVTTVFDSQYWEINKFGAGTFTANISFTVSETVNSQPQIYNLYKRDKNSEGNWGFVVTANSVNETNKTITFNSISSEGQYMICEQDPEIYFVFDFTRFDLITNNFNSLNAIFRTYPETYDVDNDGLLDLFIGKEYSSSLSYYKQDSVNSYNFTLITDNFSSIRVVDPSSVFCDLDHNGLLDLLIGDGYGNIYYYEQDSANSLNFDLITESFNSIDVGEYASPQLCDIDHDGLLELLVGSKDKKIYLYEQDSIDLLIFSLVDDNFNGIQEDNYASLDISDLDHDGLLDMLVGYGSGNISRYEQDTVNSFTFDLITNSFNSMNPNTDKLVPETCDIDNDGAVDMFVGQDQGNVSLYEQPSADELDLGTVLIGKSKIIRYNVVGTNTSDINLSCSSAFQISHFRDSLYSQSLTLQANNNYEVIDTVYVKFTPTQETYYSSTLIHSTILTDDINLPLSGTGIDSTDGFPGTALDFDGYNDYVNAGHGDSLNVGNTLTIEAWVYPDDLTAIQSIYSTRYNEIEGSFQLGIGPGNGGTNRIFVTGAIIGYQNNNWVVQTEDSVIYPNEWTHIVYTRSGTGAGTHKIYVNGEEKTLISSADYTFVDNNKDKLIGSCSNKIHKYYFNGKMDEIRLWNKVRTEAEIRENMFLPLSGYEPGLVGYWQFNETEGDSTLNISMGTTSILQNTADTTWINSDIPFGSGFCNTQIVSATANVVFTDCDLTMDVIEKNETDTIVVSKIEYAPNIWPFTDVTVLDKQYWEISKYGAGSFTSNISFTLSETLSLHKHYKLFRRDNNSCGDWEFVRKADNVNTANSTIVFDSLTEKGQYLICSQNPKIRLVTSADHYYELNEYAIGYEHDEDPEVYDVDNDGLLDVLITNFSGSIRHFEQDSVNSHNINLISDNILPKRVGGWGTFCVFCDIDHDSLVDVLIGETLSSNLYHFEQDSVNAYSFHHITDRFLPLDYRLASPETCDLDNDGLIDLLVGEENGQIHHYEQVSENSYDFKLITDNFCSIDVGGYSSPEVCDLNHNGLTDLLIGNGEGNIYYYEQGAENPEYIGLITTKYASIQTVSGVYNRARVTSCDMDHDGLKDLIVGSHLSSTLYEQSGFEEIRFGNLLPGKSSIKSYIVEGLLLTSNVTLSCEAPFQISKYPNGPFTQSLTLQAYNDELSDSVFVKFTPTQNIVYNDTIIHTASGAESRYLPLSGSGGGGMDNFVGTALEFNGTNDYVRIGNSPTLNTGDTLTIEAWVKPADLSERQSIYSTRKDNTDGAFQLEIGPGNGGTNRVAVTGKGTWVAETEDSAIFVNEWNHIVYTRSGNASGKQKIFVNGEEKALSINTAYTIEDNTSEKVIAAGTSGKQWFKGKMEEVRLWSIALPDSVIRENIYLPLSGNENGLVSCWQFNERSGEMLPEIISGNCGIFPDLSDNNLVESTIPFGPGSSNTQIVSSTGNVIFSNTDVSMNFTAKSGTDTIVVTKIDTTANVNPANTIAVFDDQYWVIDHFGPGTFTTDLQFTTTEDLTTEDQNAPRRIVLYTRESNSDSAWSLLAKASSVDAGANKVVFSNIDTSGQFIITRGTKPDNDAGDALDFDGTDDYVRINKELSNTVSADTAITIEYWFKGSQMQSAVRIQNGSGYIVAGWGVISPLFLVSTDGGTLGISAGDVNIIEDGNWHHLAMTWQKNTINGFVSYLDGELVFQRNSADVNLPVFSDDLSYLGSYNGNAEFLNGKLDEVRIWNNALDSTQIRENMHRTLTGTESGLVAYWQFNEGSGTATADCIGGNDGTLINMTDDDWVTSSAPIPFTTVANGAWEQDTTWDAGQNAPVHPWSRIAIKHQVTLNSNIELIEINFNTIGKITITTDNTLTVTGHKP